MPARVSLALVCTLLCLPALAKHPVFPGTPAPISRPSAAQAQPDALVITPYSLVGPPMRVPTQGKAGPPALRPMPNNYGPNARAKIRAKNVCNGPVEVAIMFWYNPWGDPADCKYKGVWGDGVTRFCVHYWLTIKPGETLYMADTGYSAWFYTVRLKNMPWERWTSDDVPGSSVVNLRWAGCKKGSRDCYTWAKQDVGALDIGAAASNYATVGCAVGTLDPPPSNPRATPATNVVPFHFWDVWYFWDVPDPSAAFAIDVTMTVQRDPGAFETRYYWSHYVQFSDAVPAPGATLTDGPAAYLGVQSWGASARGLIFSVWNGVSGRPGAAGSIKTECKQFSGEGLGTQCFTAFRWRAGVPYRFRVSLLSRQASGDTLRGELTELRPGGATQGLGDITVPAYYGSPSRSCYFYEVFSRVESCASFNPARIQFSNLRMKSGARDVAPNFNSAFYPTNYPCPGWVAMDVCGTNVTGAGPLTAPINLYGSSTRNRC